MALPPPQQGSTALVTGASSGIGEAFSRALAERGHGVTLVARSADKLEKLAKELTEAHGVRTEAIPADLSDESARDRMVAEVEQRGLTVEVLVNNAGFGIYVPFPDSDRERELMQVRLLVEAVVDLDGRYVPGMVERGRGAIVNLSSTAGFQPLPGNNTYAAAKAFVLYHTEALHEELRDSGVSVTAVCPGPVETGFQEASDPLFADRVPKMMWRDPTSVAEDSLKAVERNKRSVIPGGLTVRAAFAPNRVAPASVALPVARMVMGRELSRGG